MDKSPRLVDRADWLAGSIAYVTKRRCYEVERMPGQRSSWNKGAIESGDC
jgi:hypothetical protein